MAKVIGAEASAEQPDVQDTPAPPPSSTAVAEEAWNATKEESDPAWGAMPNAELKSKLVFACERVWVTGVALTNFEIKCKALITGVEEEIPQEIKDARKGEDAPNAVVALEPLPPLPFTPGEAPPRPTPSPSEERSFAGSGAVFLDIDEFAVAEDIVSVVMEDGSAVPAYNAVPPNQLQALDAGGLEGGGIWASGVNVLVNAYWADMQVGAKKKK